MNILVVSQNFTKGGLETNIYTQYNELKNNHKFYFAFGNYSSNLNIKDSKIFKDFNFDADSSIKQFCEDVERLVKIIKEEKIDVIHVHPFFSLFPAVFAAKLCRIPVMYTIHGVASVNFTYMVNDTILFQTMMESEIDEIFAVSKICVDAVNNITNSDKAIFLPNALDVEKYKKNQVVNNKIWAAISRISVDKLKELKLLISQMNKLDIEKICIYGDGDCKEELQNYINNLGLTEKVELLGHCDNLHEELNGKFNGIIGIGRVALEAICMGYPTLLIGYGKVSGIIDKTMFETIKNNNFINKMLPNIDSNCINMQLKKVYNGEYNSEELCNLIREEFSAEKVFKKYENILNSITNKSMYNFEKIYEEICNVENLEEKFYESRIVYIILKLYIETECFTIGLKNYFINFNNYFNALDTSYRYSLNIQSDLKEINSKIEDIQNDIFSLKNDISCLKNDLNNYEKNVEEINTKLQEVEDKINLKFLTYNTIHKAKNRKKTQE